MHTFVPSGKASCSVLYVFSKRINEYINKNSPSFSCSYHVMCSPPIAIRRSEPWGVPTPFNLSTASAGCRRRSPCFWPDRTGVALTVIGLLTVRVTLIRT